MRGPDTLAVGRPQHAPTDHSRTLVRILHAMGMTQKFICEALGINAHTLKVHYDAELRTAKAEVYAQVGQTYIAKMLGGASAKDRNWRKASDRLLTQFTEAQMGWRRNVNLTGAVGIYDLSKLTDEQLDEFERLRDRIDAIFASPEGRISEGEGAKGGGEGEA